MNNKINIAIITHKNCDGDAVMSTLSLAETLPNILNDKKINVIPIIEKHKLPFEHKSKLKYYTLDEVNDKQIDYIIVCDVNEQDRVYGIDIFNKVPIEKRFLIDHHDRNRQELVVLSQNKFINPKSCSTCEIIASFLLNKKHKISNDIMYNLYLGMASDTFCFQRSVTSDSLRIANILVSDKQERNNIKDKLLKMNLEQEKLYKLIKENKRFEKDGIRMFNLSVPIEMGDITKLLKHPSFDSLTAPIESCPISIFIIEIENNYFIKFKKIDNCDIDILKLAIACNGGGHSNRCAGRFYNTSYDEVIKKIINEYGNITKGKLKIKQLSV